MNEHQKILVVDNKPDFVKLAQDALEISGYQVITDYDRKSGLEITGKVTGN